MRDYDELWQRELNLNIWQILPKLLKRNVEYGIMTIHDLLCPSMTLLTYAKYGNDMEKEEEVVRENVSLGTV